MRWRVNILVNGFCGEHEKARLESGLAVTPDITEPEVTLRREGWELSVAFTTNAVLLEDAIERARTAIRGLRERELDVQISVRRIRDSRVSSRISPVQVAS